MHLLFFYLNHWFCSDNLLFSGKNVISSVNVWHQIIFIFILAFDETGGSPLKKKHKKKKRKKRRSEYNDPDASSGGESNAATPSGSTGECHPNANDDGCPATPYGVSVNVKPDEKKILLKFSLKRPTMGDSKPESGHKDKKDKKRKKSKDHERKRHHSRDRKHSSREDGLVGSMESSTAPTANGVPMTAKPVLVASPNTAFTDQLNRKLPAPSAPLSPRSMLERITAIDAVKSPGHSLDLHSVFDPDGAFPENFLKDLPNSAIIPPSHADHPSTLNYNDFLPTDLLSVTNLSPHHHHPNHAATQGAAGGGGLPDDGGVYRGSFMIASHLEYDAKPPGNFLDHISNFHDPALSMSTPHKMSQPNVSQATPMGLAGYLNSSKPQSSSSAVPTPKRRPAPAKPAARRRGPVSKRK